MTIPGHMQTKHHTHDGFHCLALCKQFRQKGLTSEILTRARLADIIYSIRVVCWPKISIYKPYMDTSVRDFFGHEVLRDRTHQVKADQVGRSVEILNMSPLLTESYTPGWHLKGNKQVGGLSGLLLAIGHGPCLP